MKKTHTIILVCISIVIFTVITLFIIFRVIDNRMRVAQTGAQSFNEQLCALDAGYYNSDRNYCLYYANDEAEIEYHTLHGEIVSANNKQTALPFSSPQELYVHIISFVNNPNCYYHIQKLDKSFLTNSVNNMKNLQFYEFDVMQREDNKEILLYENLRFVTSDEGAALIVCVEDQFFVIASEEFSHLKWKQESSK